MVNGINILLPAMIGAVYLNFGTGAISSSYAIGVSSTLGLLSMIASCISFVFDWSNNATKFLELSNENYDLYLKFKDLALKTDPDSTDFDTLVLLNDNLDRRVLALGIKEEERRKGYRSSLIQFNMACSRCDIVPENMKPSNCPVCGNF